MASSAEQLDTTVVQITNLSPQCTKDQLKMLMAYLGRIKDIQLFPPEIPGVDPSTATTPRVAYVEYEDSSSAGVALHLSNTVFVDRAMMVVPVMSGKIPEATIAESLSPQAAAGMLQGQPTWPDTVVTQMSGSVLTTEDPELTAKGLPPYPPLPASTDPTLVQDIRRTIYVSDLDPKVTGEMLLKFFGQVGEIKYARMAGEDNAERRAAYIEYTDQRTILKALSLNNIVFSGRNISVQHSKTNVIKPIQKDEATERHMNEAMSKVKEAQKLISAAADTKKASSKSPSRRRSRSRSRDRGKRSRSKSRRSRSRSRRKRRSSRSRSRKRSRSRRRSRSPRRRRSRSRGKPAPFASSSRRSRSRDRRRSRTRSPLVIRRRRSRSRERKRSRTPPRSYLSRRSRSRSGSVHKSRRRASISPPPHRRSRSRDRSRERRRRKRRSRSSSLRRRSRSRSGSRHRSKRDRKRSRSRDRKEKKKSSRDKDRDEKKKESKVKRDYDEEEKGYASADSDKSFGPKEPPKPVPVPNSGSDSSDKEEEGSDASGSDSDVPPTLTRESHQTVDMDMSD